MGLTNAQLDRLGQAVGNVEAAVQVEEVRQDPRPRTVVVGDALVLALALKGFVVREEPEEAALLVRVWGALDERN